MMNMHKFIISEDVEITSDGQKILLEAGDEIKIEGPDLKKFSGISGLQFSDLPMTDWMTKAGLHWKYHQDICGSNGLSINKAYLFKINNVFVAARDDGEQYAELSGDFNEAIKMFLNLCYDLLLCDYLFDAGIISDNEYRRVTGPGSYANKVKWNNYE